MSPFSHPIQEAHHLHEVEHVGESEWTPWIALLGLLLFFASVFIAMTAVTLAASYFVQ